MIERFQIRIPNPLDERPVNVEIVGPGDSYIVEPLDKNCVVLKNEWDVLNLIGKVNKARIQAERKTREVQQELDVFREEALKIIGEIAWRFNFRIQTREYYVNELYDSVRRRIKKDNGGM